MDFNSYKKVISNCNHIVKVGMVSAYALFLGVNTALASVTEYMDQKVSLKTQNYTIESVIQQVEKQTDYLFVYDKNDVDVKRTVYVNGSNTDVIELLKGIFDNTDIDCKVLGNNITLSKITNVATRIAQQDKKTAKGNVIDSTGEPVIGASVVEQGTTNGTVTDINGNFTLNLSTPNAKIEISFIGYKTQVLTAQFGKQMAVKLVDDTELLDEVVVVGYGSQKKVNMTGAVATIDSKSLASRPISNISQGLQGLAPGVTVTNAGGQPGQDTGKILIRGLGSFNASSPMVLIDVPVGRLRHIIKQETVCPVATGFKRIFSRFWKKQVKGYGMLSGQLGYNAVSGQRGSADGRDFMYGLRKSVQFAS